TLTPIYTICTFDTYAKWLTYAVSLRRRVPLSANCALLRWPANVPRLSYGSFIVRDQSRRPRPSSAIRHGRCIESTSVLQIATHAPWCTALCVAFTAVAARTHFKLNGLLAHIGLRVFSTRPASHP